MDNNPHDTAAPDKSAKRHGHRFKPGQSGNPRGMPPGTRHKALVALDAIGDAAATEILQAAITAARNGDMRATDILLKRIWPERKGRPLKIELPDVSDAKGVMEAMSRITAAVASGEITTDEAQALTGIIEAQRRAIETSILEERIAALEAKGIK